MAAAGGAVNSLRRLRRYGVRLATVVRQQGVPVDGFPRPSQPAHHQGADAMSAGTVGRYRHSGPLELRTKAYRPVPDGQHRAAPPLAPRGEPRRQVFRGDRDGFHRRAVMAIGGGIDLAAARVDDREHRAVQVRMPRQVELLLTHQLDAPGQRLQARDPDDRQVVTLRERAGGGDAEPQAGEAARTGADADASDVIPADLRLGERLLEQRLQRLGVARALARAGIVAPLDFTDTIPPTPQDRDRGGGGGGVDADDRLHGSISIVRRSSPACASRTR